MGELDDLDAAGTGDRPEPDEDDVPAATEKDDREDIGTIDRALDRLDFMDALDDLAAGGSGGLATGVEIMSEGLVHSPYDGLLDAFEPVRDIADHVDIFDDLF